MAQGQPPSSPALPVTLPPSAAHAPPGHYHLMGIGGIGLSAFARLLSARGFTVSGCDAAPSELTRQLEQEGIRVSIGHDAAHLDGVDVLIASEAVSHASAEWAAARERGIEIRPRMSLMNELLCAGPSVGVVGTHGKTTTTSMTAVAMLGAGLDPAAFVGGIVPEFGAGSNARAGHGPFVAEIDESDRNFGKLCCETAIFLNADDDHVGGHDVAVYWNTVEDQHAAFLSFVRQATRVLYCRDWPGLDAFVAGRPVSSVPGSVLSYGLAADSDFRAVNLRPDADGTTFEVEQRGEDGHYTPLGEARVRLPGLHNVQNGLAALAATVLYGGEFALAAAALSRFDGPRRRWERVGHYRGALIIDDYAHNAAKVAAVVAAARQTGRRVRLVFQPHRYIRTQQSWERMADSLMPADEVFVLDIAAAGETPIAGVHSSLIVDRMARAGHRGVFYAPERAALHQSLLETAHPGDVIVTVGAGDVWQLSRQLAEAGRLEREALLSRGEPR